MFNCIIGALLAIGVFIFGVIVGIVDCKRRFGIPKGEMPNV